MIHIGVCDDREGIRIYLESIITEYLMQKGLLFEVRKFETGLDLLCNRECLEILFLDVSMPGLNGIETGRRLREMDEKLKIIYITAYEHYALEAFRVRAFNYLVKPIDQQRVYDVLDEALKTMAVDDSRAILKFRCSSFLAHHISYIEVQNRHIIIHTALDNHTNGRHEVKGTLKSIEPVLMAFRFEKVRRGVWINPVHVKKRDARKIYMPDGEVLTFSQ